MRTVKWLYLNRAKCQEKPSKDPALGRLVLTANSPVISGPLASDELFCANVTGIFRASSLCVHYDP